MGAGLDPKSGLLPSFFYDTLFIYVPSLMAERQSPKLFRSGFESLGACAINMVGIAQLVRAVVCGTTGCEFESRYSPEMNDDILLYTCESCYSTWLLEDLDAKRCPTCGAFCSAPLSYRRRKIRRIYGRFSAGRTIGFQKGSAT